MPHSTSESWKAWLQTPAGKAYSKRRNETRYARNLKIIREAKDRPCTDCGIQYPYYVMEFDHVPSRGRKAAGINNLRATSVTRLKVEIAKCDVVCSNCHKEREYQRNGSGN